MHRDETTHTEDKLHAVTPASASAKVAISTWSVSDWTRDEESKTILSVMIDGQYGVSSDSGSSSTDVNISVGQNDKATVSGAWGKSTLDVAADGAKTSTKSGLVVTDFENKAGMSYVVSGKFTEALCGGDVSGDGFFGEQAHGDQPRVGAEREPAASVGRHDDQR